MRLHFPIAEIRKGIEECKTAKTQPRTWDWKNDKEAPIDPGFLLVGDHGVYLMPNTKDGVINSKRSDDPKKNADGNVLFVVYAKECNPKDPNIHDWYEIKGMSFGYDDGSEYIPLKDIETLVANAEKENAQHLEFEFIDQSSFSMGYA